MNNETLKSDLKDWLTLPLTKEVIKLLTFQRQELFDKASNLALQSYHKKEFNDHITLLFGKVDGFDTVLGFLESLKDSDFINQLFEEND